MKNHQSNYCSEPSAANFSDKLVNLMALAASGSSSAHANLLAGYGVTMEPDEGCRGDFILVQTQRLTVSI